MIDSVQILVMCVQIRLMTVQILVIMSVQILLIMIGQVG